ncbi:MAG: hypothetical protein H6733_17020 [Alphaproteobacteria bacterium]|nr:hypothetical protein [Alphaproteobacteria bacterium]
MDARPLRVFTPLVTALLLATLTACLDPDAAPGARPVGDVGEAGAGDDDASDGSSVDTETFACTTDAHVVDLVASVRNDDVSLVRSPTSVDLVPSQGASADLWRLSLARGLTWRDAVIPCLLPRLDDPLASTAAHVLLTRFSGVQVVATPTRWNFLDVVEGREGQPLPPAPEQRAALVQAWRLWLHRPADKLYYRGR